MKTLKLYLEVSVALLIALAGCTPKAVLVPEQAPTTPMATPAVTTLSATPISGQDEDWAKVVEAAKKEGHLTLYAVTPFFAGDAGIAMARAFKDRYGISMDYLQGRGADWLERLKVEQRMGQQVGDVVYASAAHLGNMKNDGLLDAVPELPMLREKGMWNAHPLSLDPEAFMIQIYLQMFNPGVNTRLVKPEEEPKSFSDLLQPRWKDRKIAIADPRLSSLFYLHFVPLVNNKAVEWDFIKLLYKQNPVVMRGGGDLDTGLARGDFPIGITHPDSRLGPLLAEGAPIKPISMKEGDTAGLGNIGKVKGAPHPNSARLFLNWLLSDEGQDLLSKTHGVLGVNSRAPDWRHATLRFKPTKLFLTTSKDMEDQARFFAEGFISKLVGQDK